MFNQYLLHPINCWTKLEVFHTTLVRVQILVCSVAPLPFLCLHHYPTTYGEGAWYPRTIIYVVAIENFNRFDAALQPPRICHEARNAELCDFEELQACRRKK